MALIDNFTNTNGTTLTSHDANWTLTAASQTDTGNWLIQSNELEATAFRSLYAYYSTSATDSAEITVKGDSADYTKIGPAVRMASGSEGYAAYFTVLSGSNYTRVEIAKDGSFFAQVTSLSYSNTTDHTIRIVATDNGPNVDLEVFVDDSSVYTGTDSSTPIASGNDGIYNNGGSRAVAARIDDFTDGSVSRGIINIDTDNDVQAGQTSVTINAAGLDASPATQTATLGGETLTVNSWSATSVNVDIPLHIDLEWGSTTNQLALTDDTGTVTLENVTLSTPTGWETVTFTSAPNIGTTSSFYEEAITDIPFTAATSDTLAWESATGLTVDGQTIPVVSPPVTVTGDYKWWDDSAGSWTSVSSYNWIDGGLPADSASFGTNDGAIAFFRQQTGLSTYQFNELATAYYKQVGSTSSNSMNEAMIAAQDSEDFKGFYPRDWRN